MCFRIPGPTGEILCPKTCLGVQNYFSSGLNKAFSINWASSRAVFFRVLRRRRCRNGPLRPQGLSRRTIAYKGWIIVLRRQPFVEVKKFPFFVEFRRQLVVVQKFRNKNLMINPLTKGSLSTYCASGQMRLMYCRTSYTEILAEAFRDGPYPEACVKDLAVLLPPHEGHER
jgi:hypothetical protein